ncbi:MAG: MBL fold metallo-hydrolase, partial [Clostridia bacterium]|nr:MBL fold metallo-hydrolase [Clostridia bacterium]
KENLPLPSLTVLTHWHWDHTFGMHAVNGLCLANALTNRRLVEWKEKIQAEGPGGFYAIAESVRKEYSGNKEVIVIPADLVFSGEMILDPGGCRVKIAQAEAPHTEDSTLVYVVEDKTLFLGDSTCPAFPHGSKDKALSIKLADRIKAFDPEICVEGHWTPVEPADTLADLLS